MRGSMRYALAENKFFMFIKRHVRILTVIFLIMCVVALPPLWYNTMLSAPKTVDGEAVKFTVESGLTTKELANRLFEKGLIKSPLAFNIYAKMHGHDVKIKSGSYLIDASMSSPEIIEKMVLGDAINEDARVTIPEGKTLEQIAVIFEAAGLVSAEEFLKEAKIANFIEKYEFLKDFPQDNSLEGLLFPDTYFFPRNKSAKYYMEVMLSRFKELIVDDEMLMSKLEETGLTLYETIILASIVEAEAQLDREKPIIAGVFYNRLRVGKPFESCATVEYVLKEHKEVLTYKDLEVDSPYNTYKYLGLPPSPIGAPGLKTVAATIEPEDVEYLYFVANGDGSHTFSKTFDEHIKASNKIQKGN